MEEENLHITLKFFGNIAGENLSAIKEKLSLISEFKKFSLTISEIGQFSERVLWLGVFSENNFLEQISKAISSAFSEKEEKSFHLTIARNKNVSQKEFLQKFNSLKRIEFREEFIVSSIDLMESILSSRGPKYSVLEKFPLKFS